MKLIATERFKKEYAKFPKNIQERVDKKLKLLAQNLRHPSLRVKKIKGTLGIWEASISRKYRLTFKVTTDALVLRAIGEHDETLEHP